MRKIAGWIRNLADGNGPPAGTVDVHAKPTVDNVEVSNTTHITGVLTRVHVAEGSGSTTLASPLGHFGWEMELSPGPINVQIVPHDPQTEYRWRFPDESAQYGKAFQSDLKRLPWAAGKDCVIWDAVWDGHNPASAASFSNDPSSNLSYGQGNFSIASFGAGADAMPVDMPLEQMIYTYVGGPGCWSSAGQTCGNGETGASVESYLQDTIARLDRYYGVAVGPTAVTAPTGPVPGWTPWSVAGSAAKLWLPSDIRFRIVLTPRGPNRSGAALNWTGTTRHETGNERPGTNADMHSKWQDAGTPGHPDGKIGVHFYSDDHEIIQKIPVDEQGVHSGDWRNHQHTGCERCVNSDGNSNASERIASYLDAGLLRILNTTALENLYPHHNTPGSCPVHINTHWKQYETTVDQRIREHGR